MQPAKRIFYLTGVVYALIVICLIGLAVHSRHKSSEGITGRITEEVSRPNRAEDGYHGYKVVDNEGNNYDINATGYLNTPLPPSDNGEECVDTPEAHTGDRIRFNLPEAKAGGSDSDSGTKYYQVCFKKGEKGYFFDKI
jgi:hypothetical protein